MAQPPPRDPGCRCGTGWVGKADASGGSGGHRGCRWQSRPPLCPGGCARCVVPGRARHGCLPLRWQGRCQDGSGPGLSLAPCLPLALPRQPLVAPPVQLPFHLHGCVRPNPLCWVSHCSLPKRNRSAAAIALPSLCHLCGSRSRPAASAPAPLPLPAESHTDTVFQRKHSFPVFAKR